MVVFSAPVFLLYLPGIEFVPAGKLPGDYISKNQTAAINGLFTLFVYLSRVSTYIKPEGPLDTACTYFKSYILRGNGCPRPLIRQTDRKA